MKVITINQPFARIAYGYKKYEFRTWKINYCGDVLICVWKSVWKNISV